MASNPCGVRFSLGFPTRGGSLLLTHIWLTSDHAYRRGKPQPGSAEV